MSDHFDANKYQIGSSGGAWSSDDLAIGVLPRTCRGIHIAVAGQLNFKDAEGVTVNLASSYFNDRQIYPYMATEILAGTTATGRILY